MSGFENYAEEARQLEVEIQRKGIVLGIDWDDPVQVAMLARQAIAFKPLVEGLPTDPQFRVRVELFGLAQLMLQVMRESAQDQVHTHGGPIWKTFGRALWNEWQAVPAKLPLGPG